MFTYLVAATARGWRDVEIYLQKIGTNVVITFREKQEEQARHNFHLPDSGSQKNSFEKVGGSDIFQTKVKTCHAKKARKKINRDSGNIRSNYYTREWRIHKKAKKKRKQTRAVYDSATSSRCSLLNGFAFAIKKSGAARSILFRYRLKRRHGSSR